MKIPAFYLERVGFGCRNADTVKAARGLLPVLALLLPIHVSTAQIPVVTIDPATQITSTSAVVTGTINPNGVPAGYYLQWGLTTAYGSASPFYGVAAVSTATNVTAWMNGLSPSTTYHFRLMATNSAGVGYSGDMTLTTTAGPDPGPEAPTVTVDPATGITSMGAAVTGTVNPKGQTAACFVQWGTTTAYGSAGPVIPVPAAYTAVAVSNIMIGLSPNTTYHYRLAATNSGGVGYSTDMTMTTTSGPAGQPPSVVTQPPTSITTSSAVLGGLVSPGGLFTTFFFRWGLDTNYGNTLPPSWVASNDPQVQVFQQLAGLTPGTTYHFQIVATNTAGTTFGADQAFITQGFITNSGHVFTYLVTNDTVIITGYSGPGGEVTIPSTMLGLPVTTIGDAAFANNLNLTSVTIPDSITTLGSAAFAGDRGLTNVTIPNSITSISANAFDNSGLTSVVIPDSVTNVGYSAFGWCPDLADLKIGNHVAVLGPSAFSFCPKLTRVVIPDSVIRIEDGILSKGGPIGLFGQCVGLTNVTVGSGVTYLGAGAFAFCPNLAGIYFRGNAPALNGGMFGERIFDYSESVIVYYLPGTTGWGATYAGRPTMLWNPTVPSEDGSVVMQQGRFGFNIAGTPDIPLVIEVSSNPTAGPWVAVQTCTLTNGSFYFTDPDDTNTYSARFYRIRSP